MFERMTYEKLNKSIENPRSEPYEDYFGDMEISEEDKKKRVSLAERLEDNFLFVLALLFTMQQYGDVDWEKARIQIEAGYINTISKLWNPDSYMESYIRNFSYDFIDATKENQSKAYYYSFDRAMFMSENEAQTSYNYKEFVDAIKRGKSKKQWIDIRDKKERETHRKVGRTVKPIMEPFLVGDSLMQFPKDFSMNPSAQETVNCRCRIIYY